MVNFINVLLIKSSQKNPRYEANLQTRYESEQKTLEREVYELKIQISLTYLPYTDAARYCVEHSKIDGSTNSPVPFYVLTFDEGVREAVNVSCDASELTSYLQERQKKLTYDELESDDIADILQKDKEIDYTKEYYRAAARVMTNIQKAVKDKIVLGYTFNSELANKYTSFKLSIDMPVEELEKVWEANGAVTTRLDILQIILGKGYTCIPSDVRAGLVATENPFHTILWEIVKYVVQENQTLDVKVSKLIIASSEVKNALISAKTLKGLDFSRETQFAILYHAMALGAEYVAELRTKDGWLGAEEMPKKAIVLHIIEEN